MFRPAEAKDVDAIARIYNQSILPGVYATAQIDQVSRQERLRWLEALRFPYGAWVCLSQSSGVIGWCSLGEFAVRPRLPRIGEVSVYVDTQHRSGGVGAKLLMYLVDQARRRGFRSLVSISSERNITSIAGAVAYGFRPAATLYQVGRLGGSLENATWLQKDLRLDDPPPYRRLRDKWLKTVGDEPRVEGVGEEP